MQKVSRRQFIRVAGLGAAGLAIAACAPAADDSAVGADVTAEVVSLRYQSRELQEAAGVQELWSEFYPEFKANNPDIDVEFLPQPGGVNLREGVLAQMVAGDAPDLIEFCCWSSTFFVQKGETLNLQAYIDRDADEVNLDDYYDGQFDPWVDEQGDIHLMPRFTGTMALYYNIDMFEEMGVDTPPHEWGAWNHEDYVAIGENFVSREPGQPINWATSNYGMGANWLSQYWIRGFGANMVDPDDSKLCGLGEPAAIDALNYIHSIIWDSHIFAYGSDIGMGVNQLFESGRIAMMEMGPLEPGRHHAQRDLPLGRGAAADGAVGNHHPPVGGRHDDLEQDGAPGRKLGDAEVAHQSVLRQAVRQVGHQAAVPHQRPAGVPCGPD